MGTPADHERNRRVRGGDLQEGLEAFGPQPLLNSLSAIWLGMEQALHRGEGPSAAPRGVVRGRGVRRKAHWAIRPWRVSSAVIGARRLGRLSHMS
jgi:hypothetical protein